MAVSNLKSNSKTGDHGLTSHRSFRMFWTIQPRFKIIFTHFIVPRRQMTVLLYTVSNAAKLVLPRLCTSINWKWQRLQVGIWEEANPDSSVICHMACTGPPMLPCVCCVLSHHNRCNCLFFSFYTSFCLFNPKCLSDYKANLLQDPHTVETVSFNRNSKCKVVGPYYQSRAQSHLEAGWVPIGRSTLEFPLSNLKFTGSPKLAG